jgi:hypothetical protein
MALSDLNNINSPIDVEMAGINVSDPDSGKHVQLVAKMASRCSAILAELEDFQSYLEEKRMDSIVYIKGLKKDLETILKKLEAARTLSAFLPHLSDSCFLAITR